MGSKASSSQYSLGSGEAELARLRLQGRLLAPATRMIFDRAGIAPGMRILDLGSGAGDVALLLADLVGPNGDVIGLDSSPDACAKATERARERGLRNVRFIVGDVRNSAPVEQLDAVVCRLVLMYVADPVAVLKAQAERLRAGGLVVPIELDVASARAVPSAPLLTQVFTWIREAFAREGIPPAIGPNLWTIVRAAGLRPLGMMGVQPYFGPDDADGPALLAGIVRTLLPVLERTATATAAEVRIDSLQDRLASELAAAGAVFAHPTLVGAWATVG